MFSVKALYNSYIGFPVPGLAMYFQDKLDVTLDRVVGYLWLVRGNGKTVVVDTGIGSPPGARPRTEPEPVKHFLIEPGRDTVSALRREGVRPEDVDILILTHLHWDHCFNARLFPGAAILVSGRGWQSILSPEHPGLVPEALFPRDVFSFLEREAWDRVRLLPDEAEVLPGLDVFWVGGHTPCSQAVKIATARGNVILAGDVLFLYGNLEENIPVALCCNLAQCYLAMDRFRREGDLILPNHDPLVLDRFPGGVIA